MKYFLVAASIFFAGINLVFGQEGTQRMRLAQSVYEQGRLHELPALLNKTELAKFSKADLVSAYKLLALAHIYLEEPEQADSAMLNLLNTDHFYEPNEAVDPAEYLGLYKTFRTKPVFNVGIKFGPNMTLPLLNSLYYVAGGAEGKGKYSAPLSVQFGAVFEKNVFSGSKSKLLNRLTFAPEVMYFSRKFNYNNSAFYTTQSSPKGAATNKVTIKQTWLDVNFVFQMKMNTSRTLQTYLAAGPGISYLVKGSGTLTTTWDNGAGAVSGPDVVNSSSYRKVIPTITAGAGLKYKFGAIYLVAEGRVQYGFMSPVNPSTRTNTQVVADYQYTLPNYHPLTFMVNFGFVYPYFNPIKLGRK